MYSNALTTSHCHIPAKHECYVLRDSVETLFRWGGKRLHHVKANLITKICTKCYQNLLRFVKDMTTTFWCVFRFTVPTAVYLQNVSAKFHKVVTYVETLFTWGKKRLHICTTYLLFTRDNMCLILSKSVMFCRRYDKNILVCFLSVHIVCTCVRFRWIGNLDIRLCCWTIWRRDSLRVADLCTWTGCAEEFEY